MLFNVGMFKTINNGRWKSNDRFARLSSAYGIGAAECGMGFAHNRAVESGGQPLVEKLEIREMGDSPCFMRRIKNSVRERTQAVNKRYTSGLYGFDTPAGWVWHVICKISDSMFLRIE